MNEVFLIMGFRVPGHAVDGDGFRNHLMHWASSSTKSDENNPFFLPLEQWMSRSYICNPRLSLFFLYYVCSSIEFMFSFIFLEG